MRRFFPQNPSAIDYSKCIGKNITRKKCSEESNVEIRDDICISFKEFSAVVGKEKLKLLSDVTEVETPDEDLLSNIYRLFESKKISNKEESHQLEIEEVADETDNVLNIESIPVVFVNDVSEKSIEDIKEIPFENINIEFAEKTS